MPTSTSDYDFSCKSTVSYKLMKVKKACLLLSKAEVSLTQVEQNWLVSLGKPLVQLVLGEARPQPSQVGGHGLPQAGQHQSTQELVLQHACHWRLSA